MKYLLLVTAWLFYFFLHSLFAADSVKKRIPFPPRIYRLLYVVFSTAGLLALLFLNGWMGGEAMFSRTDFIQYISLFTAGAGVLIINAAFRNYSVRSFLGLESEIDGKLVTKGINSWVRHPFYTGTILITLGFYLIDPRISTLISVGCVWVYLVIGIYLEEKKLIRQYGQQYLDYRKDVAAVIPFIL